MFCFTYFFIARAKKLSSVSPRLKLQCKNGRGLNVVWVWSKNLRACYTRNYILYLHNLQHLPTPMICHTPTLRT